MKNVQDIKTMWYSAYVYITLKIARAILLPKKYEALNTFNR